MRSLPTVIPRSRWAVASLWAALLAFLLAGAGGWATELGPWYRGLKQPPWKPPDTWFGPAWTLIYACAAAAGVRMWLHRLTRADHVRLIAAFSANGLLNLGWSWLFFRVRRPDWALAEVALLWLSIAVLIWLASRIDSLAAWLLLPYLLWVSFAATLNFAVVQLNGPFV